MGRLFAALLAAIWGGSLAFAGEPPRYRSMDLSPIFYGQVALNERGDIAGIAHDRQTLRIRRANGSIEDLGQVAPVGYEPAVLAFNSNDEIGGIVNGSQDYFGFTFDRTHAITYLTSPISAISETGLAISRDTVPGVWNMRTRSFTTYVPGYMSGGSLNDINEFGVIAASPSAQPRRFEPGLDTPLALAGRSRGIAKSIDNDGNIYGYLLNGSQSWGVKWNPDGSIYQIYQFGDLTRIDKANNNGLLGAFKQVNGQNSFGLYRDEWGFRTFNELVSEGDIPATFSTVLQLNDQGQSVISNGNPGDPKYYLLTPVPEPATLAALGLGSVILLRRRRERVN